MAGGVNYNVNIAVNQVGARVVQRDLEAVGQTARSVAGSLTQLAAVAGIGFAVNDIVRYADAYQNVQNRLALVTTGSGNLARVTDELYNISQRTRTSFEATAQIYSRFAQNTERLGLSQQQLLDVVESVNQTIAISGATSTEAKNSLIQFSQGLASGTLRGDELRSVLEQLPALARTIAKGMGVAYGDLRKLAKDGKLTPEIILGALQKEAPKTAAAFAKLTPTIGQAFTVLQNGITRFIGESGKAGGALGSISGYVIALANNLNPLMNAITTVGALMTVVFAQRMVAALQAFNLAVGVFALTNPFTALLLALTALGAAAYTFGSSVTAGLGQVSAALGGGMNVAFTYQDAMVAAFSTISANIQLTIESLNRFKDNVSGLGSLFANLGLVDAWSGMTSGFESFVLGTAGEIDALGTLFENVVPLIASAWTSLTNFLSRAMVGAMNAVIGAVEGAVNAISGAINSLSSKVPGNIIPEIGPLKLGRVDAAVDSSGGLGDFKLDRRTDARDAAQKLINDTKNAAAERAETRRLKALDDEKDQNLNGPGAKNLRDPDADGKGKKGRKPKKEKDEFLEEQKKQLKDIKGPLDDYNLSIRALDQLLKDGKINQEEYATAVDKVRLKFLETQRDAMSGFEAGLRKVANEATNTGKQIADAISKGFDKAADSLTDFVMTGKFNFSDLATSIVKDLIKIQIKSMILGPLAGLLGGTGTGGMGLLSSIMPSTAAGGSALASFFGAGSSAGNVDMSAGFNGPNIPTSLFGAASGADFKVGGGGGTDSQVVAFKASPNETVSIRRPDQMGGGSGGGAPNVNVKVEHTGQTESTVQETRGTDGSKLIKVMVKQAVAESATQARRGGTALNQAFESRYGLNPAGGLS